MAQPLFYNCAILLATTVAVMMFLELSEVSKFIYKKNKNTKKEKIFFRLPKFRVVSADGLIPNGSRKIMEAFLNSCKFLRQISILIALIIVVQDTNALEKDL